MTFLLGGADPSIPGLIPSDVTFRRNLVSRPEAWREERWSVKNLFELKNARRVLVEENIFENNWLSAQVGCAILMTVANSNGRAFWVTVEDVTFRHNVVRHAGGGLNILGRDQHGDPSGVARGIRISGNLFYDIDKERWGGQETSCRSCTGRNLIVERNTVIHTGAVISADGPKQTPGLRFIFRDNLMRHNQIGVHGSGRSIGSDSLDALSRCAVFAERARRRPGVALPARQPFPERRGVRKLVRRFCEPGLPAAPGRLVQPRSRGWRRDWRAAGSVPAAPANPPPGTASLAGRLTNP